MSAFSQGWLYYANPHPELAHSFPGASKFNIPKWRA